MAEHDRAPRSGVAGRHDAHVAEAPAEPRPRHWSVTKTAQHVGRVDVGCRCQDDRRARVPLGETQRSKGGEAQREEDEKGVSPVHARPMSDIRASG